MTELFLNPAALAVYARERGLSPLELSADPAYAVHAWLAEALGAKALRPFSLMQLQPRMRVLGYSDESPEQLAERLAFNASPSVASVLQQPMQGKPMPTTLPTGARFDFELRMQATRRLHGNVEKDAFLVACDRNGGTAPGTRAQAYTELLSEKLAGVCALRNVALRGFELARVVRKQGSRGGARRVAHLTLAQARFAGNLEVLQPQHFLTLLREGVGRASGLGCGMLLLRRT